MIGPNNSSIAPGSFMPSLHNIFKAQSSTTTTITTTVTSTSSKLVSTNTLMTSRVS